jgi:8-oxo-dGTP diphosphatase
MIKIVIGEKFENQKFEFRETCFGIYEKDGKMLLVNKKNQFSFVGGGIDEGETKEECLKREFLEESGYTITKIEPLCIVDCFWLAGGQWPMESLVNFFVVNIDEKNVKEEIEDDHTPAFVDINEVKKLLPLPYHQKGLEIYFETKEQNEN